MNVACIVCFSKYNYMNRGSLTFEPLTLVPIQVKMINTDMLTQKEVREIVMVFPPQLHNGTTFIHTICQIYTWERGLKHQQY